MAIAQHIVDLINADLDGEISTVEKRELEAILAANGEARAFHFELSVLCQAMDSIEGIEPPSYLRHVIMEMAGPKRFRSTSPGLARRLFSVPAIRLAGAFAAGIVLTISFVSSDKISKNAFDDVTGLVGTMSNRGPSLSASDSTHISGSDITGTVAIYRSGQILILDFDLVSQEPVDIVAEFADKNIWFNGFAQLESSGTSVAAEPGRVTLRMEGKRRYAVYLHDAGSKGATVNLRFIVDGSVIHEDQLVSRETM